MKHDVENLLVLWTRFRNFVNDPLLSLTGLKERKYGQQEKQTKYVHKLEISYTKKRCFVCMSPGNVTGNLIVLSWIRSEEIRYICLTSLTRAKPKEKMEVPA